MGKIYFLLVRIKIKHMEIAIIKREQTGSGKLVIEGRKWVIDLMMELLLFRRPQHLHRERNNRQVRNHGWFAG